MIYWLHQQCNHHLKRAAKNIHCWYEMRGRQTHLGWWWVFSKRQCPPSSSTILLETLYYLIAIIHHNWEQQWFIVHFQKWQWILANSFCEQLSALYNPDQNKQSKRNNSNTNALFEGVMTIESELVKHTWFLIIFPTNRWNEGIRPCYLRRI